MNISFTEQQTVYIQSLVDSGDYQNSSEVVREALRLHARYNEQTLQNLRAEILKGWNSPISTRSVEDIIAHARTKYLAEDGARE